MRPDPRPALFSGETRPTPVSGALGPMAGPGAGLLSTQPRARLGGRAVGGA